MKKFILVMPLMAISFLANCNNGGPKKWYEDTTYIKSLTADDVTKENPDGSIGVVNTIKVNGLDHKVRLIGVDQDVDSKGNKIHTTWEFVNLISDKNGYSLATQWNDTNDFDNQNYLDSSIRMALVKEKPDGGVGHILWAQKENDHWSNEKGGPYTDKSVLDMLPEELIPVLKTPSKYININDSGTWKEETINDKLFLLSPKEMGNTEDTQYEEEHTVAYSYYKNAENIDRVKKQIKDDDVCENKTKIPNSAGQTYPGPVFNLAGYNKQIDESGGGQLWLRSPSMYEGNTYLAWYVRSDGSFLETSGNVGGYAFAIAPAFCI